MEKKEYVILYNDYSDEYVVYNRKKQWIDDEGNKGHTHVKNYKEAQYLINCCIRSTIPKKVNKHFLESLIRISKDKRFIERIERILDGEEPKINYHNKPKNFRK